MGFLSLLRVALFSAVLVSSVTANNDNHGNSHHKPCIFPKVRKEWRKLSSHERHSWVEAVKCLTKLPHESKIVPTVDPALSLVGPLNKSSSYYDDYSYVHMDLNVNIHGTGFFLPWHRQYVQAFEDDLRNKCHYTGVSPYWDWTKDAADFFDATIFSNSTYDGIGAWGDPNNDNQINTGAFKDVTVAYPVPHHIRRNFILQPYLSGANFPGSPPGVVTPDMMVNTTFTKANVNLLMKNYIGNYTGFQGFLESLNGPHPSVHIILGGDMAGSCPANAPATCVPGQRWSPNDPMFFLHHGMIDKLWYDWQKLSPKNKNAFAGGSISVQVDPTQQAEYPTGAPPFLNTSSIMVGDGLWGKVPISDVMSTTGGKLCYVYA